MEHSSHHPCARYFEECNFLAVPVTPGNMAPRQNRRGSGGSVHVGRSDASTDEESPRDFARVVTLLEGGFGEVRATRAEISKLTDSHRGLGD